MHKIIVRSGDHFGSEFELRASGLLLGRHTDSPLCDVFRGVAGISRRHAEIQFRDDQFELVDLNSRNGTRLNGTVLREAELLDSGDEILIGGIHLEFSDGVPPQSVAEANLHDSESICSTISVPPMGHDADFAKDAARKLHSLVGMLGNIGSSLNTDQVLEELLDGMFEIFENVEHGFVALHDEQEGIVPRAIRNKTDRQNQQVRLSHSIIRRVISKKQAVLSRNASADNRFQQHQSVMHTTCVL